MGLFSSAGKLLNKVTGAYSSAKQSYEYNKDLSNLSFQQQKEFAQNAHQWEMEDLQKAGLNPALTTGASSAGAIAGGGATSQSGGSGTNGLDLLTAVSNIYNNAKLTNAQIDRLDAESEKLDADKDLTEGGFLSRILGTGVTNKMKTFTKNRTATSAKRKKELEKRNKEEKYLKKLLTFEVKKQKR